MADLYGALSANTRTPFAPSFQVSARGSTIATEIKAGIVTFLTISYILLVNPQILADADIAKDRAAMATAMTGGIATLMTGLIGNLPFAVCPGMGVNTLFALTHVKLGGNSKELVFAWVFLASALIAILAVCRLLNVLMVVVPSEIKQGTVVGMGILLAFIGMKDCHIIEANAETFVDLGPIFTNWHAMLVLAMLVMMASLLYHKFDSGVVLGIACGALIIWAAEDSWPKGVFDVPNFAKAIDWPDFESLRWHHAMDVLPYVLILIFDVGGAMFGLGKIAGLVENHRLEGSLWGFLGAAVGSGAGACIGTSPLICAVESAAGIKLGARTGLTAVVVSLLFFLSIFLSPIVVAIPVDATAPVLILGGSYDRLRAHPPAHPHNASHPMPMRRSLTHNLSFSFSFLSLFLTCTRIHCSRHHDDGGELWDRLALDAHRSPGLPHDRRPAPYVLHRKRRLLR